MAKYCKNIIDIWSRCSQANILWNVSHETCGLVYGSHSSVVLSAPTILRPQIWIPSTPSMFFFNLHYWNCIKKINNKKQKEARIGPFLKKVFFQTLNKPSKNCQRHKINCQYGEISPHLVTLIIFIIIKSESWNMKQGCSKSKKVFSSRKTNWHSQNLGNDQIPNFKICC